MIKSHFRFRLLVEAVKTLLMAENNYRALPGLLSYPIDGTTG